MSNAGHRRRRDLTAPPVLLLLLVAVLGTTAVAVATPSVAAEDGAESRVADGGLNPAFFAEPRGSSRPGILWFWNGTMTEELIDSQLAAMREQGVEEAVIFPRGDDPGLTPEFFSEEWFDIIEHTLREAQRTGMRLWLFNDDYFPSGRAASLILEGGQVGDRVYEPQPHLRPQRVEELASRRVTGPETVGLDLEDNGQPGGLTVADGRLHADAPAGDGGGIALLHDGDEWSDYTVEYDLRIHSNAAGLIVRAPGADDGYLVDHGIGGAVNIYRRQDGALTRLAGSRADVDRDSTRSVRIEVEGSTIAVSVNGQPVVEVEDTTWPAGTIGLRVVANQVAEFDDLRVTAADGETLYEETFDDPAALDAFDGRAFAAEPTDPDDVVAVAAMPVHDGEADLDGVIDLTDTYHSGGSWDVPEGEYRLEYFHREFLDMTGLYDNYLDLMNPEAVSAYVDAIHGEYYRRFSWAFGDVLLGFWDDEPANPAEWGHTAWSEVLPGELEELGYSPAEVLPAVFGDHGRAGRVALAAYHRATANGLANYYEVSGQWGEDVGVAMLSNPYTDHYLPTQAVRWGDTYKNDQWFQIPGGDAVFNQVGPGQRPVIPRYTTSAAHQNGRDRVLAEVHGGMGWDFTPELARFVNGYMALRGMNHFVLHAAWSDESKVIHPPQYQRENTWWNAADGLVTWTGRIVEANRGEAVAETALFHPQRAAEAWRGTPVASDIDNGFAATMQALEDVQVDFDLLGEAYLDGDPAMRQQAEPRAGAMHLGPQAYRVVVLPPTPTMSLETIERLRSLATSGGDVIAYGELPTEETTGRDAALRDVVASLFGTDPASPEPSEQRVGAGSVAFTDSPEGVQRLAREADAPAATLAPASDEVRVLRKQLGEDRVFLIMNEGEETVETTATFPAKGTPEFWDPDDGSNATARRFFATPEGTAVPLRLEPYEVSVVAFREAAGEPAQVPHLVSSELEVTRVEAAGDRSLDAEVVADAPGSYDLLGAHGGRFYRGTVEVEDPLEPIKLDGTWRFGFADRDQWSERALSSWTDIDAFYSGEGVYEKTVDLTEEDLASGRRLLLELGDVRDVAEVEVNGESAGRLLWRPYRLDVTDALKPGENTVEVTVTNTDANERGNVQPSGLLGPVQLRPVRDVPVRLDHDPAAVATGDGAVLSVASDELHLNPCQREELVARIENFSPRPLDGELSAAADSPLQVSPSAASFQVAGGETVELPFEVFVPAGTDDGEYDTRVSFGDTTEEVSVTVSSDPNLARSGSASASSTHSSFSAANAINGNRDSGDWGSGNGWNDGTQGEFPDSLQVSLPCEAPVSQVDIYTLDSAQLPASRFGLRDFDVQVFAGDDWQTVDEIRGNTAGIVSASFQEVTTEAVRVVAHGSNGGGNWSRIVEIEIYGDDPPPAAE